MAKKKSAYQRRKEKEQERQAGSRRYSTGYRFALYDPVNPDAPLVDVSGGEHDKTYRTYTREEIKEMRARVDVDFANDCLISAGSRFLVGILPASLTDEKTVCDGRPIIHWHDDDDDDNAGEAWKKGVTT